MSKKRSRKLSRQERIDAYIGEVSLHPEHYFKTDDYDDSEILQMAIALADEAEMYSDDEED